MTNYPAVARAAGVSRIFLYANPSRPGTGQRRHQQVRHTARPGQRGPGAILAGTRAQRRAALKTAGAEIAAQRHRMAILLGQIRDLEHDLSPEAAQRLGTENTTIKQRVRQLTHDNKTLEDRLEAARSSNRFAGRRIVQLEAQHRAPPVR